ncbi:MAG: hypothetical protein EKK36_01985 [Bradyrhizobiaceae bacterium]|nr:MAG: hypothetical protein EKK36_01985 [Bradyrhizobiaceae bacterium]
MRATIKDAQALHSLVPANLVGYLRAHGWEKFNEVRSRFSVWVNRKYPEAEIVVPATRSTIDYASQLFSVLRELEEVENRSQLEILKDLHNSGFDVVRLAAQSPGTTDGTVKIDAGVHLFEQAREILMAAACAAVKPRPVFHSRKPQQALDYMSKARLGQTEHGSYVLTLLSPSAPQLSAHSDTELFPEEPFERLVVRTLFSSVELATMAAEITATADRPDFEPFQSAVVGGVSANLCEGIAGFFTTIEASTIDLSVAWALNRPSPTRQIPYRIRIGSDLVPTLEEAARIFRAHDKLEGYLIEGPVIKLERPDGQQSGYVTIFARVEDTMRKVTVELPEASYNLATQAHASYRQVRITGTVAREGRSYRLNNPTELTLTADDEDLS